jgi:hypothetical protein
VKKRQDTDQVFMRLRAAATAERLRRMIRDGGVFADEIDDIAIAVQTLGIDISHPHLLLDLLETMAHTQDTDDTVPLSPKQCSYLAEAEMKLENIAHQ